MKCEKIDVCIKDTSSDTPLHEACLSGHHDIVDALIKRMRLNCPTSDIDAQNSESQTPLHLACREGHAEVVRVFLQYVSDKKTSLNSTQDNEGNTSLHLACKSGSEETVEILMLNGADLLARQHKGITPVHIAAQHGFIDIARTLMQHTKDTTDLTALVDIYHRTPLHQAAYYNQVDMIKFLVKW